MLPDFFIVGAPKAGTTSLYRYLKQHPDVFLPDIKEPNFFSSTELLADNLYYNAKIITDLQEYRALYSGDGDGRVRGDASVSYLFYPQVPQRIKEMVPDARIIIMLRNPVDRAYSHYLMDKRLGYVNISFEEIVMRQSTHKLQRLFYQQFVEIGLYADQVERYLKVFGENNVHIILFEDFAENVFDCLKQVCLFLDISPEYELKIEQHNAFGFPGNKISGWIYGSRLVRKCFGSILPKAGKKFLKDLVLSDKQKPPISREVVNTLWNLYEKDVERLSILLKRDLVTCWRNQDEN